MKNTLFLAMLAAAFLGSGVANAAETLNASQYVPGKAILLGSTQTYDKLVVDTPLRMTGQQSYLDLYDGATLAFSKENGAEAICSISTPAGRRYDTVYFKNTGGIYNFTFDAGAQAIVAASAGSPITLIQDLNTFSTGFLVASDTTLKLNGAGYNETVVLDGVQFTYVGPQSNDYTFKAGEIGFTGYYTRSHNLSLVANAPAVPEPTTGSLSLLALAGLCARRRRK